MVYILNRKELVLVNLTYYMPDYTNLIQTFHWQTEDVVPHIPRVHKFLNYWKEHVEAVIKEVQVSSSKHKYITNVIFHRTYN